MSEFWKRDTVLWILAAVAVALNAIVGSYNVRRMGESEGVLLRTRTTHAEMSALLSDMKDAETGHRGYVLTGQDGYLEPYRESEAKVWDRLDRIRERSADHPKQLERLATAERLIRGKFDEMERTLGIRIRSGLNAAAAAISEGQGRQLMDEFRVLMRAVLADEEAQITQRATAAESLYRTAEVTNLTAATLAIAILAVAAVLKRREARRRERLSDSLKEAKQGADAALGRLDAFLRHAPGGIAILDDDLRFVWVNETFAAANAAALEGPVGRPLREVLPEVPEREVEEYRKVIATGRPLINRTVFGRAVIWEMNAFRVPLGEGRWGLGVIAVDMTDRHLHEERLRESESRFRTLTETMPQIVWMARPDGYRDYYNSRWYEFAGLTPEQTLGWGWTDALHPNDLERTTATWKQSVAAGTQFDMQSRFRRHDGEYQWFLARAVPVRDDAGQVVRWLGTCTGIDQQVKTAQALQESETRFRQLADAMPQIVFASRPDGHVDYFNRRWYEYTGFPTDGRTGDESWANVHDPEALPRVAERWNQSLRTGEPYEIEYRLRRHDGHWRWHLGRALPVRNDVGQIIRWYGTNTDIHDQKQQELDLFESRRFVQSVLHSLPGHLAVVDAEGVIVSVNESWRQFGVANGIPEEFDWSGTNYFDAARKDEYGERAIEGIRAVARGERGAFEMEYPCHGNGQERYFVLRANRFRGDGPVRLVVTHENISDRVRAERKVREAASQLRQLTEGMPLLMWACQPSGECDYLSNQWVEYTGVPMVEQLGYGWLSAVHPDDRARTSEAWQEAVTRGGGYEVEFRIHRYDGAYRWFAVRGIPLRDHTDRVVRWFGSCTDIDDRKRQEEVLMQLVAARTAALQRSNEELEKFAYIASHDLQEPLRKIQAFGTRLASKHREAVGEEGQDYIDRMLASAGRMRRLIEDLLAFSRVTTKANPLMPTDLNAVVRDVQTDLEVRLQTTNGRVEVTPLPVVQGDPGQLWQVFQNLIGNALKFARPGVPPLVRVTAEEFQNLPPTADPPPPDGEGWRITVEDNGIGFEQEYAERIFELFQRLHARNEYDGTGLGLAIVRKILHRHGATITARGRPGVGATFVLDWLTRVP